MGSLDYYTRILSYDFVEITSFLVASISFCLADITNLLLPIYIIKQVHHQYEWLSLTVFNNLI